MVVISAASTATSTSSNASDKSVMSAVDFIKTVLMADKEETPKKGFTIHILTYFTCKNTYFKKEYSFLYHYYIF